MKTQILTAIEGSKINKPGKYICLPLVGFGEQPVWIVEIYESDQYLVYIHPSDGEERIVDGCGYSFFALEN